MCLKPPTKWVRYRPAEQKIKKKNENKKKKNESESEAECQFCKRRFKNKRGATTHLRHCRRKTSQAESESPLQPHRKPCQPQTGQEENHSAKSVAGDHLRHKCLHPDERKADIEEIRPKLKLPPASDDATWKDIDSDLSTALDTFPDLPDAGEQLERRETFIYNYLKDRSGTLAEPKPRAEHKQNKDRNLENLRKRKSSLKKAIKRAFRSHCNN